jgi:uncharacterized protein
MKKIAKILILGFLILNLTSCKTIKEKETEKITDAPKVEFDLGENSFPKLDREVNDFEFNFDLEELEKLTLIIREFEKKTSNQIAIVSIKSIGKYIDFDKYSIDLSNNAGVGLKEKDNGLTIIFSKKLKKLRISTGTETEKILTDEICKKIIDEIIIPEFKKENYYLGIEKGLFELIDKWK